MVRTDRRGDAVAGVLVDADGVRAGACGGGGGDSSAV
jgi:hypothetical protein